MTVLQPWGSLLVTFVLGSPLVGILVVFSGGSDGELVAVSACELQNGLLVCDAVMNATLMHQLMAIGTSFVAILSMN